MDRDGVSTRSTGCQSFWFLLIVQTLCSIVTVQLSVSYDVTLDGFNGPGGMGSYRPRLMVGVAGRVS